MMTMSQSPFNEPPIVKLLSRLQQVKAKPSNLSNQQGLNQWQALCPAHADKTPSLSITECLDDTVLVKCWAGCSAREIVQAVGLELKDLFKPRSSSYQQGHFMGQGHRDEGNNHRSQQTRYKKQPSPKAIEFERLIIQLADKQLNQGHTLGVLDQQRYQLALQRLKQLPN